MRGQPFQTLFDRLFLRRRDLEIEGTGDIVDQFPGGASRGVGEDRLARRLVARHVVIDHDELGSCLEIGCRRAKPMHRVEIDDNAEVVALLDRLLAYFADPGKELEINSILPSVRGAEAMWRYLSTATDITSPSL